MSLELNETMVFDVVEVYRRWTRRKELVSRHQSFVAVERSNSSNQPSSNRSSTAQHGGWTAKHGAGHLSPAAPFSLATLRKTHSALRVEDLRLWRIQRACYILCRVISTPWKSHGTQVHMVVEDVRGEACKVSLHYFLSPALPMGEASLAVTYGDKFLIVEPYCKVAEDGEKTIRCDNPSHFVLLDEDDDFLDGVTWAMGEVSPEHARVVKESASTARLAEEAKRHYKAKQYRQAAQTYRAAILVCSSDSDRFALLNNCSECMLRLGHYRLALRDAKRACVLNPQSAKALERLARAHIGLGQYDEALQSANAAVEISSSSRATVELKEVLEKRLSSDVTTPSMYNFAEILAKGDELRKQDHHFGLMLPDYYGPIEVRPSPGRGRGTFATRDIRAGTLVIAEKALGSVYEGEIKRLSGKRLGIFFDHAELSRGPIGPADSELIWRIMQASSENSQLSDAVQGLFGGAADASEAGVENCERRAAAAVNVHHLEGVIEKNAFATDCAHESTVHGSVQGQGSVTRDKPPTRLVSFTGGKGVWNKASFLNHSCVPNCIHFSITDFVFVGTIRDVRAGEELTTTYSERMSYDERQARLAKSYGFQCKCPLCRHECTAKKAELESAMTEYKSICKELSPSPPTNRKEVERILLHLQRIAKQVEGAMPLPSTSLSKVRATIGDLYQGIDENLLAAENMKSAQEALYPRGASASHPLSLTIEFCHQAWMAAMAYIWAQKEEEAKAWCRIAHEAFMTRSFRSKALAKHSFGPMMDALEELGF